MALAAPLPAVAERSRSRPWGAPVYWHLLSLDAPTVAVLWAWSFAHTAQVPVAATAFAVLGIGTWLIYVADRLLDSRFSPHRDLRERHVFHARHRRAFFIGSAAAGILLLGVICLMPAAARDEDTLVFAASMLYFAGVHLPALRIRQWFPRELAVGILFACATAIPAWSVSIAVHTRLIMPVLLFAALCTLNCVAIEVWEHSTSPALARTISAIALCLAAAAAALLLIAALSALGEFRLYAASFASALLLLLLDRLHRRSTQRHVDPESHARLLLALRVAADAALLTPLLFVLPWRP